MEQRARQGSAAAIERLAGPPFPEALAYLHTWSIELFGRSGVSLDGLAPLSFQTIESWARLMDQRIAPHEVQALLWLDSVRRHPEVGEEE